MAVGDNKTAKLTSLKNELMKTYIVYNGDNVPSQVYEAPVDTADGEPCLLTTYTYVPASTRVEKSRESESTWQAAYDI